MSYALGQGAFNPQLAPPPRPRLPWQNVVFPALFGVGFIGLLIYLTYRDRRGLRSNRPKTSIIRFRRKQTSLRHNSAASRQRRARRRARRAQRAA